MRAPDHPTKGYVSTAAGPVVTPSFQMTVSKPSGPRGGLFVCLESFLPQRRSAWPGSQASGLPDTTFTTHTASRRVGASLRNRVPSADGGQQCLKEVGEGRGT